MPDRLNAVGVGIYTRAEAARLLHMNPPRLRRWVSGYTYWLRRNLDRKPRSRPPVIQTDLPRIGNVVALSFLELIELRTALELVQRGVSLQHVRAAADFAASHLGTRHPLASQRIFTDGYQIFSAVSAEREAPNLIEWQPGRIAQIIAGKLFERVVSAIEFDERTSLARRWWPGGRSAGVVVDPRIAFGAPVIAGTGIRTSTIGVYPPGPALAAIARAYDIDVAQARAASEFERQLAA